MRRVVVAFTVAALTTGACGSSHSALSKAEFVKRALVICTKSYARSNEIRSSAGSSPTIEQVKDTFARRFVPAFRDEVDHLGALKPPKGDRKAISKMLDDLSTGIDQGTTEFTSLKRVKDLSSLTLPPGLKAFSKEATAYGLGICASAGLAP